MKIRLLLKRQWELSRTHMRSIAWSCRGLISTEPCTLEGNPYQQYNMGPGMEFALHDGQAQYTVTDITRSMPYGIPDISSHYQQTGTWPAQSSPSISCFPPTLSEQNTLQPQPNAKVPIPRISNHHPQKQKSAFILTPLQSTLHQ
jgi:hypothetical protein